MNIGIFYIFVIIFGIFIKRRGSADERDIESLYEWSVYFPIMNLYVFHNMIPYVLFIPLMAAIFSANLEYKATEKVANSRKL